MVIIVMGIVIFDSDDKEGEGHRVRIKIGSYGGQDQDMVNILCFATQYSYRIFTICRDRRQI